MKECLEKYTFGGYLQAGPEFMVELGIDFYDIAYFDSEWWYACNDSSFPVRAYDTNGVLVESISSSVLPAAHGMAFDSEGYLWVSNMSTDEIYKIDLNASYLTGTTWATIKASF